jgi:hypothetical protein
MSGFGFAESKGRLKGREECGYRGHVPKSGKPHDPKGLGVSAKTWRSENEVSPGGARRETRIRIAFGTA